MIPITVSVLRWSDVELVPDAAGVYAFHNAATGAIYIGATGSLKRRCGQWRNIVVHETDTRRPDRKLRQELSRAPRDGWRFSVLMVADETTTRQELFQLERHAIHHACRLRGHRCLNEQLT